jgi:FKBP-type peptidyl-prolyl cis-trans isomerase FkpA
MSLSLLPLLSFVCFFLSLRVCSRARAMEKERKMATLFFLFCLFLVNSNNLVETPEKLVKSEEIMTTIAAPAAMTTTARRTTTTTRRRRREVLFPGFLTFLLSSSSSSSSKAASSIRCKDVKVGGEGKLEAFENDVASVNYALFLSDEDGNEGAKIDSAKFFVFGVGTGEVIRGFDLALLGDGGNCSPMRVGGVREVLIPPELGYGAKEVGGGRIPANSYLKFVVELVQIK